MKFGEVLLQMQLINEHQLDVALKEQDYNVSTVGYSEPLGNILLRNGVISESDHELALIEYFKLLTEDESQPVYVRQTARVAYNSMREKNRENCLAEETKLTMLKKISEYEDKIGQFKKSIATLSKMEQKKVIVETIDKENKEIDKLIAKIEVLRTDLEKFA